MSWWSASSGGANKCMYRVGCRWEEGEEEGGGVREIRIVTVLLDALALGSFM